MSELNDFAKNQVDAPESVQASGTETIKPEVRAEAGADAHITPAAQAASTASANAREAQSAQGAQAARGTRGAKAARKPRGARAAAAEPAVGSPSTAALQAELAKERQRGIIFRAFRSTVFSLVVVAAAAIIVTTLVLPILQIQGTSMTDTLHDQDVVVALRTGDCQTGDVIAFYYNNKILVKRVIARSGQWVDIDDDGNVYVDGVLLDEPYVKDKAKGDCNIKLPYQVPESRIFVMGDHRSVSVDSRSTTVGCVANEQIVGRLVFCAWPFARFGLVR